jgi:hypothetical protein
MFDFLISMAKTIGSIILTPVNKISWYKNVYRPQVKAQKNPFTTCFSHSGSWFIQNVSNIYTDENLSPDRVTTEINSQPYREWTRQNLGQSVLNQYDGNLNQLWDVQRKYIEDKLKASGELEGKKVVFKYNVTKEMLKAALLKSPVIVNTSPIYNGQRLGHIMLIVDYVEAEDCYVVDDSFGDARTNYTTGHENGNDLHYKVVEFEKIRGKMAIYLEY